MKIAMYTLVLFFSFLLFTSNGLAQVEFTPTQQILMRGSSCQELEGFGEAILNWALSVNSKATLSLPECFCSAKSCQMDVAKISPYLVLEFTNFQLGQKESAFNGPNCFNAALFASKTLPSVSFTHPYEITTILNSSLCKERKLEEDLQAGDILVVRDQSNALFEIHAGIYVNEQLSFSKYGESSMMPYSYGLNVQRAYGVQNEKCNRIEGLPTPGSECYQKPFVNFFTCEAMYTYVSRLSHQPGGIVEAVRLIYAGSSRLDSKISRIAFKGATISADELLLLQADLKKLYAETVAVSGNTTLNTVHREFLKLMHVHIFSLYEQTRRIAVGLGKLELSTAALSKPSL